MLFRAVDAAMDHTELLENIMERTKSLQAVRLVFLNSFASPVFTHVLILIGHRNPQISPIPTPTTGSRRLHLHLS
jgi:hypothetical protein